jgi:hypothetical protein
MTDAILAELAAAPAGVVYSCSGAAYVQEALLAARSSIRHNALPHVLFASVDVAPEPGLTVARFEPSANPYVDKIANMRRSPFQRTIYLDTDTFVVDEIVHVLALLDRYDVVAAHAPGYRGLADPQVPLAFYELNTGVLAWRASDRLDAFMRDWEETYAAWLLAEPFPGAGKPSLAADQPAFRRCAWQHEINLGVLAPEYNLRLGEPATIVDRVRVIHGRPRRRSFEQIAAAVNATPGPRTWPQPSRLSALSRRLRRALAARHSPTGRRGRDRGAR